MSTIRVGNIGPLTGNTSTIADPGVSGGGMSLVNMTAISLSGTYVDFTGIPSWTRKITIIFYNAQKSGSTNNLIQLGTGSGLETTGYTTRTGYAGDAGYGSVTYTTGFPVSAGDASSTCIVTGIATAINVSGYTWVFSTTGGRMETSYGFMGGGSKTLSGSINRVRFITGSGTDTYSGGTVNVYYE